MATRPGAAGYSTRPLYQKLGIKDGLLIVLQHAPARWSIRPISPGATVVRKLPEQPERPDVVLAFFRELARLQAELPELGQAVHPGGSLWVAWPRQAGGHASDMTENAIRDAALPLGLVDVKVSALDTDWSGLKLVWRLANR